MHQGQHSVRQQQGQIEATAKDMQLGLKDPQNDCSSPQEQDWLVDSWQEVWEMPDDCLQGSVADLRDSWSAAGHIHQRMAPANCWLHRL